MFYPANELDGPQCQRIERYLNAVRSTLLFAKGVILVEGDAELILIPTLIKKVFGVSLDELGVSVVNMSSSVFCNVAVLFDENRIQRHCTILTDLDESIVELPEDDEEDDDLQSQCRASQVAGEQRREELDASCGDNEWIKICYAPHTFEVDFLMAGNSDEVVETLPSIFKGEKAIERSKEKLESNDVAVAGKEMLRLAQLKGKGWFSLLLAEQVTEFTIVPDYILEAVAFACHSTIDRQTLCQVARHRCDKAHDDDDDRKAMRKLLKQGDADAICQEYGKLYSDDVLSDFLKLLD